MAEQILYRFQSRRNEVLLVKTCTGVMVRKHYRRGEDCRREQKVYELLRKSSIPHACLTDSGPSWIQMRYLPGVNLVDILEKQEISGCVNWTVWKKLAQWLVDFYKLTGLVVTDVNLRNFLYEEETENVYGLDFEGCSDGSLCQTAALLAAYIQNYAPEKTPMKREIAVYVLQFFSEYLNIPVQELLSETEKQERFLTERRQKKP